MGQRAGMRRGRGRGRKLGGWGFEWLEERLMLDSSPPEIVVGRTLSSYFVGDVQNHQETITYTVYNEQADPETGVLLTTTLRTGRDVRQRLATARPERPEPGLEPGDDPRVRPRQRHADRRRWPNPAPDAARLRRTGLRHARRRRRLGRHARRDACSRATSRPQPARLDARRQHDRPVHPGRGGASSTTTRSRSSTSCTRRSATTRTPARCAARGARSGRARAMRSTSPAWAWP